VFKLKLKKKLLKIIFLRLPAFPLRDSVMLCNSFQNN
jgi:hypothetical protein